MRGGRRDQQRPQDDQTIGESAPAVGVPVGRVEVGVPGGGVSLGVGVGEAGAGVQVTAPHMTAVGTAGMMRMGVKMALGDGVKAGLAKSS